MSGLLSQLQHAEVAETMKRFGFKMEDIFPGIDELKDNPYRKHTWIVKENHGYLVVNAIPEKEDQDHLFWEEWYAHAGEVHHHILSLWKPHMYHEIFSAPDSDDIHPSQCFSRNWYVVEDEDMRSLLLRR